MLFTFLKSFSKIKVKSFFFIFVAIPLVLAGICFFSFIPKVHATTNFLTNLVMSLPLDTDTNDYSGTFNNGTNHGATTTTGKLSSAYQFDGTGNTYIEVPHSNSLNMTGAVTVSAWIKADSWQIEKHQGTIVGNDTWSDRTYGYVLRAGANGVLSFAVSTAGTSLWREATSSAFMTTGNWYHVVGVFNGSDTVSVYINGIQKGTSTVQAGPMSPSYMDLLIGKAPYGSDGNGRAFTGAIDEVQIWNKALSGEEISTLYNSDTGTSLSASQTFAAGDGDTSPYQITNCQQLQNMNLHVGANYILNNDIDCSATVNINLEYGFVPIGTSADPFTGTFNGAGHKITGLTINRSGINYIGFLGRIFGATIENVGLEDVNIVGGVNVGGISGGSDDPDYSVHSTISNVYVTGTISGTGNVGGLIGWQRTPSAIYQTAISQSYFSGNITGGASAVGGLIGLITFDTDGTSGNISGVKISECYTNGSIASYAYSGGLVGQLNNGTGTHTNIGLIIENSYSTMSVGGVAQLGGLYGFNSGVDKNSITNSYFGGAVVASGGGTNHVGGFIGNSTSSNGGTGPVDTITNSFMGGTVSGSNSDISFLIGQTEDSNLASHLSNVYFYDDGGEWWVAAYPNPIMDSQFACANSSICAAKTLKTYFQKADFTGVTPISSWDFLTTPIWEAYGGFFPTLHFTSADDPSGQPREIILSPNPGTYNSLQTVSITSDNAAHIYYSTVSTPTTTASATDCSLNSQEGTEYTEPITISSVETVYIKACNAFGLNSGSYDYNVTIPLPSTPTASLSPGQYYLGQYTTFSSSNAENIYYSTSQMPADCSGTGEGVQTYVAEEGEFIGISVPSSETIYVRACNSVGSATATFAYTIVSTAPFANGTQDGIDGSDADHAFTISNCTQLQAIGGYSGSFLDKYFKLTGNINCSDTVNWNNSVLRNYIGNWIGWGDGEAKTFSLGVKNIDESNTKIYVNGYGSSYIISSGFTIDDASGTITFDTAPSGNIYEDVYYTVPWQGFTPIGDEESVFDGFFDGQGYAIDGLNIIDQNPNSNSEDDYIGLFGVLGSDAIIENVGLTNENIVFNNTVANSDGIGGLAGYNNGIINSCYTKGKISGASNVGGLVGYNNGDISYSYSTASVNGVNVNIGDSSNVGGFAGLNSNGDISDCYATGNVLGIESVGGFVGENESGIYNSYAIGNVDGVIPVGGFAGYTDGEIDNCFSTGVANGSDYVGGFTGENDYNVINSFYDQILSQNTSCIFDSEGDNNDCTAVDSGEDSTDSTYFRTYDNLTNPSQAPYVDTWDFSAVWNAENNFYPTLKGVPGQDMNVVGYESKDDLTVTPDNPGRLGNFQSIYSTNSQYWITGLSQDTISGFDSQVFKITPGDESSLTLTWTGHGDATQAAVVHIFVWNTSLSPAAWEEVTSSSTENKNCTGSSGDCTLSAVITVANYLKDGYVWVWAKADKSYNIPQILFGPVYDSNSGIITWRTDKNSNSEVIWDAIPHDNWNDFPIENIMIDSNLTTEHAIDFYNSNTYYMVRSVDADDHSVTSLVNGPISFSCPFLYTYDGSKYNFIVETSSAGYLGKRSSPTTFSYPYPETYTRIPAGNLVAKQSGSEKYYDIKATTELNEVNYYDASSLFVLDHSPDVDVYPDYRNNGEIHTISKNAPSPISVLDQDGNSVSSLISQNDNVYYHSSQISSNPYLEIKLAEGDTTPANIKLVIKRSKEGMASAQASPNDQILYENSQGQFVALPADKDPFTVKRSDAPISSRNSPNAYGVDIKVIDLSGLDIKDNTIRLVFPPTPVQWDIDWLAIDTSPDSNITITNLSPYYADLHYRGISKRIYSNPSDSKMKVMQPVYDELLGNNDLGSPLSGTATRYGDVSRLLSSADDKYVIMVQGDEMSLKYSVPNQAEGTERDFIYYSWAYNKPYPFYTGAKIDPLPFRAMSKYPYDTSAENYPYEENQTYIDAYNTRAINWTTNQILDGVHHSLNTDYIALAVGNGSTQICDIVLHAATYNAYPTCGVATCVSGYTLSGGACIETVVDETCPTISHTATYNVYPTCGVATCVSGYTLSGGACVVQSSGGSGGWYYAVTPPTNQTLIEQLKAKIAALQAQISAMSGTTAGFSFTKRLTFGMVDNDVRYLQIVLNSDKDTQVSTSGKGSKGFETTKFGLATYAAVKKFQQKYFSEILTPQGFKAPTGIVAGFTIKKLNTLLAALGQ